MQISRIFDLRISLVLVLLPFLGGCYYLFAPTKVGSSWHQELRDPTTGGTQGDAVRELYDRGTESVVVGWEHFYEGYGIIERIHNHYYRGGVKFNVGLLSEPPAKTITKAILNYTIQAGARSPSEGFIESCATKLLLAKDDWHGMPEVDYDKVPDTIIGAEPPYKDLPGGLLGSVISVDVTGVVKAWAAEPKTNFGFVFAGSTEEKGLFNNNDKCWTLLGDFTLKVDYSKP